MKPKEQLSTNVIYLRSRTAFSRYRNEALSQNKKKPTRAINVTREELEWCRRKLYIVDARLGARKKEMRAFELHKRGAVVDWNIEEKISTIKRQIAAFARQKQKREERIHTLSPRLGRLLQLRDTLRFQERVAKRRTHCEAPKLRIVQDDFQS